MRTGLIKEAGFERSQHFDALATGIYKVDCETYVNKKRTISNISKLAFKAIAIIFSVGALLLCSKKVRIWAKELLAGGEIVVFKKIVNPEEKKIRELRLDMTRMRFHLLLDRIEKLFPNISSEHLKEKINQLKDEDLTFLEEIHDTLNKEIFRDKPKRIKDFSIFRVDVPYVQFEVSSANSELSFSVACWPPKNKGGNWSIGKKCSAAREVSILNNQEINLLMFSCLDALCDQIFDKVTAAQLKDPPFAYRLNCKK
ncbi:hypothetical protein PHSC3_000738 [Chlamydiales bacterium STE3]|nr:hypothetical protein PHSC3_000738 [Chlamydiales bacterium STE3]